MLINGQLTVIKYYNRVHRIRNTVETIENSRIGTSRWL